MLSLKLRIPLAAMAVLIVSLSASAARAEVTFTMPASGGLEDRGTETDRFVVNGIDIACDEAVYRGDAGGRSRVLALEAEYDDCTAEALSGFPADFFQELCDYVLHDPRAMPGGNRWTADVDLRCAGGYDSIGWGFYEIEMTYGAFDPFCSMLIPEGPDVGTAQLTNLPGRPGGIEIDWSFPSLDYAVYTLRGPAASLLCGSSLGGMRSDSSYFGSVAVFAEGNLGDLSVSG